MKSNEKQEPVVIKIEEPKVTEELKLDYHSKYSFTDYSSIGKNYDFYFTAKYDIFFSFYHRLNKFKNLIPWSEKKQKIKKRVYRNVIDLFHADFRYY